MCRFHSPDGFVLAASSRTGFRISLFAPMPFLPMPLPISFKAGEGNLLGTANAHRENDADSGGGHSVARGRDVRALPFLHPQPSFTCGKSELLLVFPPFTCSEELVPTAGGAHTSFAGYLFDGFAANQLCISTAARPHPQHVRSQAPAPCAEGKSLRIQRHRADSSFWWTG